MTDLVDTDVRSTVAGVVPVDVTEGGPNVDQTFECPHRRSQFHRLRNLLTERIASDGRDKRDNRRKPDPFHRSCELRWTYELGSNLVSGISLGAVSQSIANTGCP